MAGAACKGSVKQIMHMSSASWRSGTASVAPAQPNRHGRHVRSERTPPHKWLQGSTRLHASLPWSWTSTHSCNTQWTAGIFLRRLDYQYLFVQSFCRQSIQMHWNSNVNPDIYLALLVSTDVADG